MKSQNCRTSLCQQQVELVQYCVNTLLAFFVNFFSNCLFLTSEPRFRESFSKQYCRRRKRHLGCRHRTNRRQRLELETPNLRPRSTYMSFINFLDMTSLQLLPVGFQRHLLYLEIHSCVSKNNALFTIKFFTVWRSSRLLHRYILNSNDKVSQMLSVFKYSLQPLSYATTKTRSSQSSNFNVVWYCCSSNMIPKKMSV